MLSPYDWTADDWTAIATCATFLVAAIAAVFSYGQVTQARRAREDQVRPFVVVDLQSSLAWQNMIDLVVENVGKTIAKDVRVEFQPPLESSQSDSRMHLQESVLVKQGIPTLPPGRRVSALFDMSHDSSRQWLANAIRSYGSMPRCARQGPGTVNIRPRLELSVWHTNCDRIWRSRFREGADGDCVAVEAMG